MSFTFSWTIKASSCLWAFLLWSEDNTQTHVHVCLISYLLVVAAITFRLLNVSPHHVQLNNLNCYSRVEQVHQLLNLFRITSLASSYLMTLTGGRFHLTIWYKFQNLTIMLKMKLLQMWNCLSLNLRWCTSVASKMKCVTFIVSFFPLLLICTWGI